MKKNNITIFMAAALLAVGCSTPDVDSPRVETGGDEVWFVGTLGGGDTRVLYENYENTLRPTWVKSDLLGMYVQSGGSAQGSNVAYKTLSAGSHSDFASRVVSEAIVWADDTSAHDFYAYYPYNADAGSDPTAVAVSVPAVQHQTAATSDHLGTLDFMYAATKGAIKSDGVVRLSFDHLFSVLEVKLSSDRLAQLEYVIFRCKDPEEKVSLAGASVDLATGALNVSSATATPEIRLECTDVTVSKFFETSVFMMITPGHAGKEFDVIAKIGSDEHVVATVSSAAGIPVGRTAVVKGSRVAVDPEDELPDTALDLSSEGTANTYFAFTPNTEYKFRADVKGNGVVRNYTWIVGDNEVSEGYDDTSLDPKSILVLWYNTPQEQDAYTWVQYCPVQLSSIMLYDGYIRFRTSKNDADKKASDPAIETFKHGNVVIAAFAEEGLTYDNIEVENGVITNATVLWSWNIVVTDADPDATANQITVGDYTMMDRNLGATNSDLEAKSLGNHRMASALGNLYQWGRKDPFPGVSELMGSPGDWNGGLWSTPTYTPIKSLQKPTYTGNYGTDMVEQAFAKGDLANSTQTTTVLGSGYTLDKAVDYSVRHPYRLLYSGTATGAANTAHWAIDDAAWSSGTSNARNGWRALWGNPAPYAFNGKSIYDPCPVGWKISSPQLLQYITDNGTSLSYNNERTLQMKLAGADLNFIVTSGRDLKGKAGQTRAVPVNLYSSGFATEDATNRVQRTVWGTTLAMGEGYGAYAHSVRCMKDTGDFTPEPPAPKVDGSGNIDNMDDWNGLEPEPPASKVDGSGNIDNMDDWNSLE
jgi:hypothetical protein